LELGIPGVYTDLNVSCSKICTCKYLSDAFYIHTGLNQGDDLLLLIFDFGLEHASVKVQKNKMMLELNRTC
jgi:hypothetical protein